MIHYFCLNENRSKLEKGGSKQTKKYAPGGSGIGFRRQKATLQTALPQEEQPSC